MIVKIQRVLNNPGAPALIYDHKRTMQFTVEEAALPEPIKAALSDQPKVYWHMIVRENGNIKFKNRAGDQEW
jgi:hypothetical protein